MRCAVISVGRVLYAYGVDHFFAHGNNHPVSSGQESVVISSKTAYDFVFVSLKDNTVNGAEVVGAFVQAFILVSIVLYYSTDLQIIVECS